MIGKVLWFDIKKGFGFARSESSPSDVFIHYSKILAPEGEFRTLEEGDIIEFETFSVERGTVTKVQAKNIKLVEAKRAFVREVNTGGVRRYVQ